MSEQGVSRSSPRGQKTQGAKLAVRGRGARLSGQAGLFGTDIESAGAILSPCGVYRYLLWRVWDIDAPACNFLMLNPSTADATKDDPTIRRCIRFAQGWGYGSLLVTNLFALRSTDPRALPRHPEPIGTENDARIQAAAELARVTVCAWGEHGTLNGRAADVLRLLDDCHTAIRCLGQNKSGQPMHPLYRPADSRPIPLLLHDSETNP